MYAVLRTGGKQYRVQQGTVVDVELLGPAAGEEVTFEDVLLVADGSDVKVGQPLVKGATVKAKVVNEVKDAKKLLFKKTRRQDTRRKKGHRQPKTRVRITAISV